MNNILLELMSKLVLVSGVEPCRVCCCWLHIVLMGDTWMVQGETDGYISSFVIESVVNVKLFD